MGFPEDLGPPLWWERGSGGSRGAQAGVWGQVSGAFTVNLPEKPLSSLIGNRNPGFSKAVSGLEYKAPGTPGRLIIVC